MTEKDELKAAIACLPVVQRLQELETIIDGSVTLKDKIDALKEHQKKMVHAKEFQQVKQYAIYLEEYESMKQEILDFPFMEEYLELLEVAHQILGNACAVIEEKINKVIYLK